ncbi:MAG: hypothetical protein ACFCBW_14160 [Candidatus Competibacterales bacterium]
MRYRDEFRPLGHPARQRHVVQRATPALLDDLEAGDTHQRCLALVGAAALGDGHRLLRGLFDPSVGVRRLATRLVPRCVVDVEPIVEAYGQVDAFTARGLCRGILRHGRTEVADALLTGDGHGDLPTTLSLIQAASRPVVEATLGRIDGWWVNWAHLAIRQPDLTVQWITSTFEAAAEAARPGIWSGLGSALVALAPLRPDALLDLAEGFAAEDEVPTALAPALGILARRRPERLAEWLTRPARCAALGRRGLAPRLLAELRQLPEGAIKRLARSMVDSPKVLARLLAALAPSQRGAVFEQTIEGHDTRAREWPEALLAVLPHPLRHREADRMVGLASVVKDRRRFLTITAHRAIAEARPILEAAARSARAEDRAQALRLLVDCTARDRRQVDTLLQRLLGLKNEQDPVRQAVWRGLAAAPVSMFNAAQMVPLAQMVQFTLDARDTAYTTRAGIQQLAYRLLVGHATDPESAQFRFGLTTLDQLAGQRHILQLPPLHFGLPRGAEHAICQAVLPWLKAASGRSLHANAIGLAKSLGRRAWQVPELQALLEQAAFSKERSVAEDATRLWLAPPRHRDQRVRRLLDHDSSAIMLFPVFQHLHQRRQEWLDPFLEERQLRGRFASGKTIYLLPADDGFYRWHPDQQRKFARLHHRLIGEAKQPIQAKVESIKTLARMPVHRVADLRVYVDDLRIPIQEAALGALVYLDQPGEALPVLLEFVAGDVSQTHRADRARVAMYAIPRLARLIPQPVLLDTIDDLMARPKLKITVQKEALRLLGASRGERAVEMVSKEWARDDLHRDVRIACLHAARSHLDREGAWTMLEQAPLAEESVALSLLDPNPAFVAAQHRPRYRRLLLRLSTHGEARVREALFARLGRHVPGGRDWVSGGEGAVAEAARESLCAEKPASVWPLAAQTLARVSHIPEVVGVLQGTVKTLLQLAASEPLEPVADAPDLSAHHRIRILCNQLVNVHRGQTGSRRGSWIALAPALLATPAFWHEGATLSIRALDWKGTSGMGTSEMVSQLVALVETMPSPAFRLESIVEATLDVPERWTTAVLQAVGLALADHQDAALRGLAVVVLGRAGKAAHWPAPMGSALATLRADRDVYVAQAARRVVVSLA